jgi:hypothetical protein
MKREAESDTVSEPCMIGDNSAFTYTAGLIWNFAKELCCFTGCGSDYLLLSLNYGDLTETTGITWSISLSFYSCICIEVL